MLPLRMLWGAWNFIRGEKSVNSVFNQKTTTQINSTASQWVSRLVNITFNYRGISTIELKVRKEEHSFFFNRDEKKQAFQFEPTLPTQPRSTNVGNIFPNILDLAHLVDTAYKNFDACSATLEFSTEWQRIATAIWEDGFRAAAYYCSENRHLVIAFPGTETTNGLKEFGKDFMTDIWGVGFSKETSQILSAILFTQEVLRRFGKRCLSTSVTGHSLGGYLAQICTLYAEYPDLLKRQAIHDKLQNRIVSIMPWITFDVKQIFPFHLHCVAFDSPGCEEIFVEVLGYKDVPRYDEDEHERWRKTLDSLDICVILADSNIVNTSKHHLQRIQLLSIVKKPNARFMSSHALGRIIENLTEESLQIEELYETHLLRKHRTSGEKKKIFLEKWYVGSLKSCRINFFTKQEISFLEDFLIINRGVHPEGIQSHSKCLAKKGDKILQFCKNLGRHEITCENLHRIWIEGKFLSFRSRENPISLVKIISGLKIVFAEDETISREKLLEGIFKNFGIPVLLKSISQEYLQNIARIREEVDSRFDLREQGEKGHCLHFVPGNIPIPLCMGYIAHGLQKLGKTKVMFSNTTALIRWQEVLNPERIFSDLDTEIVVLEVDKTWDTIGNLLSKMQENAQHSGKFLILVTEKLCQSPCFASNTCYEYGNILSESLGQKWNWSELDEQSKQVLWNYELNIYGSDVKVKHIFGGEREHFEKFQKESGVFFELISYAYLGKALEVVKNQKPLECYISRQFYNLHLDLTCLQNSPVDFLKGFHLCVSCNDDSSFAVESLMRLSDKLHLTLLDSDATKNQFRNTLTTAEPSVLSSHFFRLIDENVVWQASSVTCCSRLLKCEGEIDESQVFGLESDCLVFADEPGMGKSAFLEQLCYEYKQNWHAISKVLYYWPIHINLNHCEKMLTNTREDWSSLDSIYNFFVRHVLKFESEMVGQLFKYNFDTLQNVVFFIDSFDELSNVGQRNVIEILKTLRQYPSFKFIVASRVHANNSLEEILCTSAYKFVPLSRLQQREFLLKRWNLHLQNEHRFSDFCLQWEDHKTILETFVYHVLDHVEGVIGMGDSFIGIPLQLVLLEQVQRSGFENLCEDLSNKRPIHYETYIFHFESKLALYEEFVTKKIDTYIVEKKVQRPSEYYLGGHRNPYQIHYAAAMLYLKKSMFQNNCGIDVEDLDGTEIEKINRTGICEISCTMDGSRSYRFVHETVAEYFVAKYLANDLKVNKDTVINFLKVHYCEPYFIKVRFFFDSILFDTCKVSTISCLDKLQRNIDQEEYLNGEEIPKNETAPEDALGRTLLHYATAYGCLDDEILWNVVLNKKNLYIQQEDKLGATCLTYTILSMSFQKSEYLRQYGRSAEYVSSIIAGLSLRSERSKSYLKYHSDLPNLETFKHVTYPPDFNGSADQYIESERRLEYLSHGRRFPEEWIVLAFVNVFVAPLNCNMQWLISNASNFLREHMLWKSLLSNKKDDRVNYFFGLFKNCEFKVQNPTPELLEDIFQISRWVQLEITPQQIVNLWDKFTCFQRALMIGWLRYNQFIPFLEGKGLGYHEIIITLLQSLKDLYDTFCPLTVFLCGMFHFGVLYRNETMCNHVSKMLEAAGKGVVLRDVWNFNFRIKNKTEVVEDDYLNVCLQSIFNGQNKTWELKRKQDILSMRDDDYADHVGRIIMHLMFNRDHETFYIGLHKCIYYHAYSCRMGCYGLL